jgi:hypothetical protein
MITLRAKRVLELFGHRSKGLRENQTGRKEKEEKTKIVCEAVR